MSRKPVRRRSLRRALHCASIVAGLTFVTPVAGACPICHSETGQKVRAGIFDENFASNLFGSLLPFPIFLGIVAAIHGLPARGASVRATASRKLSNVD